MYLVRAKAWASRVEGRKGWRMSDAQSRPMVSPGPLQCRCSTLQKGFQFSIVAALHLCGDRTRIAYGRNLSRFQITGSRRKFSPRRKDGEKTENPRYRDARIHQSPRLTSFPFLDCSTRVVQCSDLDGPRYNQTICLQFDNCTWLPVGRTSHISIKT